MRYAIHCLRAVAACLFVAILIAGPAMACGPQVRIQFAEESPDRFRITFEQGPKLSLTRLAITLDGSAAGVIFDDYDGMQSQGPQPNKTGVTLSSVKYDTRTTATATLTFQDFVEKRYVDFASDLDDRGLASDPDQNHIYEGELAGATARATLVHANGKRVEITGRFDKSGTARLGERACV